jgi:two-component system, cell cycle sensor histidine kinase and response regulator CckA
MINLLLIEDNAAEARLLQEILKGSIDRFHLVCFRYLKEAIDHLQSASYDIALLDLNLPDSQGLASLDSLIRSTPSLPIVVLTNTNDDKLALAAVQHGAQDYLFKRQIQQDTLVRSLRYAIERKQNAEALRKLNDLLEHRVRERTIELEQTNKLLQKEIEEKGRVQERLELAQRAGKIGTFEWNIDSGRLIWSKELESLYGFAVGEFDGTYEAWMQRIHPEDRSRLEEELKGSIVHTQGLNVEFRIIYPDDEIRWIAAKGNIFKDVEGKPQAEIGVHIDITDKKQLEAQFLRAQRLESLGTLAGGIAHDLNNILTPILAVGQLLPYKFPDLDERTRGLLDLLESSAKRGAEMVKQILSFARGNEGKHIPLQAAHLLQEVRSIAMKTFPKTIEIQVELPERDLLLISGDATQLHQVFLNLVVNARDAMPDGGILTIAAQNFAIDENYAQMNWEAHTGSYIAVSIADTGTGILPELRERIFDPFFTTKQVGQGTGLGLATVLGIVKNHGGFVRLSSEIGKGSQFMVYLPATEETERQPEPEREMPRGKGESILVVDDEAAIRQITQSSLEDYNYRVLAASDGIEAIGLYAQHQKSIEVVLMDILMPNMDGIVAIRTLKKMNSHVKIIATSGLSSQRELALAAGANLFLAKPYTVEALLRSLSHLEVEL